MERKGVHIDLSTLGESLLPYPLQTMSDSVNFEALVFHGSESNSLKSNNSSPLLNTSKIGNRVRSVDFVRWLRIFELQECVKEDGHDDPLRVGLTVFLLIWILGRNDVPEIKLRPLLKLACPDNPGDVMDPSWQTTRCSLLNASRTIS